MVEERGEPCLRLAVCGPAPVTHFPGPAPGACFAGSHSPRPPHLAPPTPQPIARLCSSASQLLLRSLTSHVRSSNPFHPGVNFRGYLFHTFPTACQSPLP